MFSEVDSMYHIYIDAEFDAVKINRKFHQMVISLGAVMVNDEGTKIDEFYSLIKPYGFSRLSNIVKKITHMTNDMILAADKLDVVEKQFKKWIYAYTLDLQSICLYSFGPDDRRTIVQNCVSLKLDTEALFAKIIDLQRVISSIVTFQGKSISSTLSLDDLKSAFGLKGAVDHNALSDAKDLMQIHQAFLRGDALREENVAAIVNRKAAKQMEVQMKQRTRLIKLMRERFSKYKSLCVDIIFYPEVIEQLRLWEDRDKGNILHWRNSGFVYNDSEYAYEDVNMQVCLDIKSEIPSIILTFTTQKEHVRKQFLLQYRNATIFENIIKRLQL